MPCNQTLNGLTHDCTPSQGGVVEVYLANFEDVTAVTVTSNVITAITMASSAKFKKYALPRNTANFASALTKDKTTDTHFWVTDLLIQVNRMDTAKRVEITALSLNDLVAIVKDANGVFWYLGKDEPLTASAGEAGTGTQRTDRNGYSITLQDNSIEAPYEVDADIISGLVD